MAAIKFVFHTDLQAFSDTSVVKCTINKILEFSLSRVTAGVYLQQTTIVANERCNMEKNESGPCVLPTQNTSINSVTFIQVYNNSEVNFTPIITKSE